MKIKSIVASALITAVAFAAPVNASPETDYLAGLNQIGLSIYDANLAIRTGWDICSALDYANGTTVAENFYLYTPLAEVPNREVAAVWVLIAVDTLCPWQYNQGTYVR